MFVFSSMLGLVWTVNVFVSSVDVLGAAELAFSFFLTRRARILNWKPLFWVSKRLKTTFQTTPEASSCKLSLSGALCQNHGNVAMTIKWPLLPKTTFNEIIYVQFWLSWDIFIYVCGIQWIIRFQGVRCSKHTFSVTCWFNWCRKELRLIPPPAAETVKYLLDNFFLSPEKLHVLMSKRPLLADI